MSRHFETSVPRPDAMVMQPRTFRALLSLAHTAKPPGPKNELVYGGSVSVASNEQLESFSKMRGLLAQPPSVCTLMTSLLSRVMTSVTWQRKYSEVLLLKR